MFSAIELVGLQQIVATKDLRLLDFVEKQWHKNNKVTPKYTIEESSSNFINKRINGPILEKENNLVTAE